MAVRLNLAAGRETLEEASIAKAARRTTIGAAPSRARNAFSLSGVSAQTWRKKSTTAR